jgi:hypothetical protein
MKLLFAAVLAGILFLAAPIVGQTNTTTDTTDQYSDVVLLDNGGKVKGRIIEIDEGDKVIVETSDGQQIDIPYDKIDTISRVGDYEERQRLLLEAQPYRKIARMNPSLFLRLGVWTDPGQDAVTGSVLGGHTFEPGIFLGVGTGWNHFRDGGYLPLFTEAHYYLGAQQKTPFLLAHAGYTLAYFDGARVSEFDVMTAGIGVGLLFSFSDGNAFLIQARYQFQSVPDNHPVHPDKSGFGFLDLGVAF